MRALFFLALGLSFAGCFDAHGLAPRDAGAFDAHVLTIDAHVTADASAPPDVGPPRECAPVRPVAICASSFEPDADGLVHLPMRYEGCGCCGALACTEEPSDIRWVHRLATATCDDGCTCDRCESPTADYAIRPVGDQFDLFVDGAPALNTNGFAAPESARGELCATFGEVDPCEPPDALVVGPALVFTLECVDHDPVADDDWMVLRDWLRCGELEGPCYVVVQPRPGDALPHGSDIFVRATITSDDCATSCTDYEPREHVRRCAVPDLEPGAFYRLFYGQDDRVMGSFTAGDPASQCDD